jgi:hypothetical protein
VPSDRRTALACSVALFALTAWPTWIVDLPPFQDLPNHLASAWVQLHPDRYPELVSNGFLKTNSALFLFLHVVGKLVSLRIAAKLFITLTLAVGAWVYPRAVARLGSSNPATASLVLWPFVHNWFLAMGMLDWVLGIPLGIATLVALDAYRAAPTLLRAVGAAVLALAVWYTHAFVFMVVCLLVAIEVAIAGKPFELRPKLDMAKRLVLPLVPAALVTLIAIADQLSTETTRATQDVTYRSIVSAIYGTWAEWFWSMTKWTLPSIVPCVVIGYFGLRRLFVVRPRFFSPLAVLVIAVACACVPHLAFRWFFFASRFIPFLWIALVLRLPSELPRWLRRLLVVSALAFSAGLGFEYVRVARDWTRTLSGEPYVPVGSRMLALTFETKGRYGDNTWPLTHVSSLYGVDRDVMSPSFFIHSTSFPITAKTFPPRQFEQLVIEAFAGEMQHESDFCAHSTPIVPTDCDAAYAVAWRSFWQQAAERYDHALLLDPSDDVRKNIPPTSKVDFDKDGVVVLTLKGDSGA